MNKMKLYICLTLFIYLEMQVNGEISQNLFDTLSKKMQLSKTRRMKEVITPNFRSKFIGSQKRDTYLKYATGLSLFNQDYVMLDNELYSFENSEMMNLTSVTNIIEGRARISTSKIVEYGNTAVMMLVLNKRRVKIVKFMFLKNNQFHFQDVQELEHASISDAQLFRIKNKLFMIIANDKGNNIALVSLYEWSGGSFYERNTINTQGITHIEIFEEDDRAIILMLHKRKGLTTICDVFEYEDKKLNMLQELNLEGLRYVVPYKVNDENYVLVLTAWKRHLYHWNGEKLVTLYTEPTNINDYQQVTLTKFDNVSLLFASKHHKVDIFMLSSQGAIFLTTQLYQHKFVESLSLHHFKLNQSDHLFVIGNVIGSTGIVENYEITLTSTPKIEHANKESDPLAICLRNLMSLQAELEEDETKSKKKIGKSTSPIRGIPSMASHMRQSSNIDDIEEKIGEIDTKSADLLELTKDFELNGDELEINGKIVVEGTVTGKELLADNIQLQTINNKKWTPDQWLSYSKNQTIAGGKDADNLIVRELITTREIDLLKDSFLNNSDVKIGGSFTIDNLITTKLSVDEINNIKLENIFMRDRDKVVKGNKTITTMIANAIETSNLQGPNNGTVEEETDITFAPHVFIDDLEVESIDGVNWKNFTNSVFRLGYTKKISGNIRIKAFNASNLFVNSINGVATRNFMTKTTDQAVNSFLHIGKVDLRANMAVNIINDLDPSKDIVTIQELSVKGPVSMENMHITGTLNLNYNPPDGEHHIVGTKESDLLQIYHGDIKIDGNLRLKNFQNLDSLKIIVGEEFNPNFAAEYWMKTVNQVLPVHVEVRGGVNTPHLQTKRINKRNFTNFLLNNSVDSLTANFVFENASFLGNVNLSDKKTHTPNLELINSESVKINGSFVIQGRKMFRDTLKINRLITDRLNSVDKKTLVTKNQPVTFKGTKIFENLVINGNLNSTTFSFGEINGVNLEELKKNTIYIDRPQEMRNLNFSSISALNFDVEYLNGRPINEYFTEMNDMTGIQEIDSLIINGKLTIGNLIGLSRINDKHPDVLFAYKLKLDDQNVLHGNVRFPKKVTIDKLLATVINKINFRDLVNRILYKNGNQTIPAKYIFENLKTKNLVAPKINNHQVDPLVDLKSKAVQRIIAFKGLNFKRSVLTNLITESISPCDIVTAFGALINPPTQTWERIVVHGNVILMDGEHPIHDIFENAVLLNQKNIIEAPVHLKNISAKNVATNEYINDVNLTHIFSDALLRNSRTRQIVSGLKIIHRLAVFSATVNNNSDISVINGIDFPDIYNKMIPKGAISYMPITGKKTFFAGLQTKRLQSNKVQNVVPEKLVTFDTLRNVTSATFDNIEIKNLTLDYVNGVDFNYFLDERVLLDGPPIQELQGHYSFYDVHIKGNVEVPEINDVDIHDIVVDIHDQIIDSKKTFVNDLYINSNIQVEMLNGRPMSEVHHKALMTNKESYINQNVKIMKPSFINGTIITNSLNGLSLEEIRGSLNIENKMKEQKEIDGMVNLIEKSTIQSFELVEKMPSEIMYIEYSNVIQLSLENTLDAQVFRLKDYVLIHIIGEGNGPLCELPESCKCPVQYTVLISPKNSINTFFSKGSQRVYSFDDKKMTVHFITNSVSTDATCRRNSTKGERSSLAWSTAAPNNGTSTMYSETLDFTGYISAVEFFTVNETTYAVIGKYYDPTKNSYNLDCVVYKFSDDRTSLTEIQRIETQGVWNLKIFKTPQGIVLIIGMLGDRSSTGDEKTLLLRFNQDLEKFLLLKKIHAYGCTSAVGIPLESENFIVLSHRVYPVLVFKYDDHLNNYLFHQNLWDPSPIGGISLFYSGRYGRNEPHLCVASKQGLYSIYTYKYNLGWQRKFFAEIDGLTNLVPFELNEKLYLLALSSNVSSVLTVVKYGLD